MHAASDPHAARRASAEADGPFRLLPIASSRPDFDPDGPTGPLGGASAAHAAANPTSTVNPEQDQPVLPRVASGHPDAAGDLLDRFGGLLWSLARRMSPTPADAEDAVQDILVELVRSAHRYDASVAGEATFIAVIARRRLVDRARRRGRDRTEPASDHLAGLEESSGPERASNRAHFGEDAQRALDAMDLLSDEQRRCIALWACHGLSHEKIARATGLPLGTTKAHIRRGLLRLRKALAEPSAQRGPQGTTASGHGRAGTGQGGGHAGEAVR